MRRHHQTLTLFLLGLTALILTSERWILAPPIQEMTTVPAPVAQTVDEDPTPPLPKPEPLPRPPREKWAILPEPIREEGRSEIPPEPGNRDPDRRVPKLRV